MTKSATKITVLYSLFCRSFNAGEYRQSNAIDAYLQWGLRCRNFNFYWNFGWIAIMLLFRKTLLFSFQSKSMKHDGQLFVLYSFLGVFTTAIFWGMEYAFHLIFTTDFMRYVGALIGLTIGYFIKYQLDKRFVFIHRQVTVIAI